MISRIVRLLAIALPIVLLCGVCVFAMRHSNAASQLAASYSEMDSIDKDVRRIRELRSMRQTVAPDKRPDQDIIANVSAVLADAGISAACFGGLQPEADAVLQAGTPGNTLRRQSVRITLNDLSVEQLGAYLERWSVEQPLWVPQRIELMHSRDPAHSEQYSCTIILSAVYVSTESQS